MEAGEAMAQNWWLCGEAEKACNSSDSRSVKKKQAGERGGGWLLFLTAGQGFMHKQASCVTTMEVV